MKTICISILLCLFGVCLSATEVAKVVDVYFVDPTIDYSEAFEFKGMVANGGVANSGVSHIKTSDTKFLGIVSSILGDLKNASVELHPEMARGATFVAFVFTTDAGRVLNLRVNPAIEAYWINGSLKKLSKSETLNLLRVLPFYMYPNFQVLSY
jgi:hypothetical protein